MPPVSTRVDAVAALATESSILFHFNCSWFSDVNGAVKFFSVVVTESKGRRRSAFFVQLANYQIIDV